MRPRPEQGRLRPGAASTHGNAGRPTHRKPANGPPAPCRSPLHKADDRGASASELVLQAPHVAVEEPIRGAPRQVLAARYGPRKAHFLRMAFIGASSGAAAFFFLMARRFMPFMAFAFLPPTNLHQDPLKY